ncbi:MAG: hypothetical protein GEU88_19415 [Solirubrobacterales bacterium]|nr:hypothetical protein [Solirubrobacterales bacterium]
MVVEVHGETARATLGSYCVSHGRVGVCSDSAYPLPVRGGIRVSPGDRVTVRTGDRAIKRVSVGLLRVRGRRIESGDWSARAERVPGRPRRFSVELSSDLERANRLDVFVRYRDRIGDADYWARIIR